MASPWGSESYRAEGSCPACPRQRPLPSGSHFRHSEVAPSVLSVRSPGGHWALRTDSQAPVTPDPLLASGTDPSGANVGRTSTYAQNLTFPSLPHPTGPCTWLPASAQLQHTLRTAHVGSCNLCSESPLAVLSSGHGHRSGHCLICISKVALRVPGFAAAAAAAPYKSAPNWETPNATTRWPWPEKCPSPTAITE